MMPFRLGFLLSLLLVCLISASAVAKADPSVYENKHFSLTLPSGCSIKPLVKAEDYQTYVVANGNHKSLVNFYLGDAPDYPKKEARTGIYETHFYSDSVDILSEWEGGELVARKLLIKIHPKGLYAWPNYLMIWTGNLSPEEMQLADQVISSVQCNE